MNNLILKTTQQRSRNMLFRFWFYHLDWETALPRTSQVQALNIDQTCSIKAKHILISVCPSESIFIWVTGTKHVPTSLLKQNIKAFFHEKSEIFYVMTSKSYILKEKRKNLNLSQPWYSVSSTQLHYNEFNMLWFRFSNTLRALY